MADNDVKLGYIGLGKMGAPMAKRLVEWPGGLIVFDLRPEAMTPLADAGASLADSVADVAGADIISITVRCGARVRCRVPLGMLKPCWGCSATVRPPSRSTRSAPSRTKNSSSSSSCWCQ